MTKLKTLELIAEGSNGVLKTSDAVNAGISKTYFLEYIKKYGFVKIANGIYLSNTAWEDGMYILQSQHSKAIFSHETALYLLGLTEREPFKYEVTVPRGYNTSSLKEKNAKPYTVKKELYTIGITELKTPMGNIVKSYNAERTICDVFKPNCNIEIQDKQFAVKEYLRNSQKNIFKLMNYAKTLCVEKQLRQYLEVLL